MLSLCFPVFVKNTSFCTVVGFRQMRPAVVICPAAAKFSQTGWMLQQHKEAFVPDGSAVAVLSLFPVP